MVMRAYGLDLPLDEVRAATGTGRDGVDALSLVEAARGYGFEAEGLQLPLEVLANLSCPAILHWDMRHFVVLERALPDGGAEIVDPAFGRLRLTAEELDRSFTGIALTVQPGPSFVPRVERPGTWSSYLTALRPQRCCCGQPHCRSWCNCWRYSHHC
jgi:ABC-type bacteriocin/lantibiotic exporter with double-glycine peptidase domain